MKLTMIHVVNESKDIQIVQLPNDFKVWQKVIGGYIENMSVYIDHRLTCHFLMDEEAVLKGTTPTIFIANRILRGDLLVAKADKDGQITSLSMEEADRMKALLNELIFTERDDF